MSIPYLSFSGSSGIEARFRTYSERRRRRGRGLEDSREISDNIKTKGHSFTQTSVKGPVDKETGTHTPFRQTLTAEKLGTDRTNNK